MTTFNKYKFRIYTEVLKEWVRICKKSNLKADADVDVDEVYFRASPENKKKGMIYSNEVKIHDDLTIHLDLWSDEETNVEFIQLYNTAIKIIEKYKGTNNNV